MDKMSNEFARRIYDRLLPPYGFRIVCKVMGRKTLHFLDVGCGNSGPTKFQKFFEKGFYVGINKDTSDLNQLDLKSADNLVIADLDDDSNTIRRITNSQKFDVIYMAHVIEHLHTGFRIIGEFRACQNTGGVIYIETPSEKSLNLPSRKGTQNFNDDVTHVRLYKQEEIANALVKSGYRIIRQGIRKDKRRILLFPFIAILLIISREEVRAPLLWDLNDFASYVFAIAE